MLKDYIFGIGAFHFKQNKKCQLRKVRDNNKQKQPIWYLSCSECVHLFCNIYDSMTLVILKSFHTLQVLQTQAIADGSSLH